MGYVWGRTARVLRPPASCLALLWVFSGCEPAEPASDVVIADLGRDGGADERRGHDGRRGDDPDAGVVAFGFGHLHLADAGLIDASAPDASSEPACEGEGCAQTACTGEACGEPTCQGAACELQYDDAGNPILPQGWSCEPERFAAGDGCDCGCGGFDADCTTGCSGPGCDADDCDRCWLGADGERECGWSCEAERYADGTCDCGCGAFDPDCGDLGCADAGCFAEACERCEGDDGALSCARGACAASVFGDGVCDCGCRERDPDCAGADACLAPGCSALACARCHDDSGEATACTDWSCTFEKQGGGDGCNCGCGAPDPDCGPSAGCATPGCRAAACVSCRADDGAPMSCIEDGG